MITGTYLSSLALSSCCSKNHVKFGRGYAWTDTESVTFLFCGQFLTGHNSVTFGLVTLSSMNDVSNTTTFYTIQHNTNYNTIQHNTIQHNTGSELEAVSGALAAQQFLRTIMYVYNNKLDHY
jgi:hypothetical protein